MSTNPTSRMPISFIEPTPDSSSINPFCDLPDDPTLAQRTYAMSPGGYFHAAVTRGRLLRCHSLIFPNPGWRSAESIGQTILDWEFRADFESLMSQISGSLQSQDKYDGVICFEHGNASSRWTHRCGTRRAHMHVL